MSGWRTQGLRVVIAGALLGATACASAPRPPATPATAEIAPIRLRNAQTGARERCGIELIRDVERANDLTWSERLFFKWRAERDARRAVQDEEQWRQQCVERYRQAGYEVESTPPSR